MLLRKISQGKVSRHGIPHSSPSTQSTQLVNETAPLVKSYSIFECSIFVSILLGNVENDSIKVVHRLTFILRPNCK